MKCFIGFGSNLGNRLENLENAAKKLLFIAKCKDFRVSFVYETQALLPPSAPKSWDKTFLNAVLELDWGGSCETLLQVLKHIERELGRDSAEIGSPRVIDLDILLFGNESIYQENLQVPHPRMWERGFVLNPLKDLIPTHKIPGSNETILQRSRTLTHKSPLIMGILNLTEDSFSDGGQLNEFENFIRTIEIYEQAGVAFLDLGAESTRNGAQTIHPDEEWKRLRPALEFLQDRYRKKIFRPSISIDTRNSFTAEKSMLFNVDCINDVSGMSDPSMIHVLKENQCQYVLMHSLSVPADIRKTLPQDTDSVEIVKTWAMHKLDWIVSSGIHLDRMMFDPGISFGKTPSQSIHILSRIEEFKHLPVRVVVGHSRKSFLKTWGNFQPSERDWESIAITLKMESKGVDILRVHRPDLHIRALRAFQGIA